MKVSVFLAHPNERSFNHAIAKTVCDTLLHNGHGVYFHDLYKEQFDALLPVEEIRREAELPDAVRQHCNEIAVADGIIIVHPNWWGQPPAILKGWIDRVIRPGVAYEFIGEDGGEGVPKGLLKARAAVVFNTSDTVAVREDAVFGDPLDTIWKNCIFGLCGVDVFYRKIYRIVVTSTDEQRRAWLKDVADTVGQVFAVEKKDDL